MKKILCILALIVAVTGTAFWLVKGANRGWTKTSIEKRTVEELTGMEEIKYEKGFVPGVDFLGATGVLAGVLLATSFFLRNNKTEKPS